MHDTYDFFGYFWLELQACGDNTGNDSDGFSDDLMMMAWRENHRVNKKVDLEAWGPPITHSINLKPNPEQITESLLNISVSLQN